MAPSRPTSPGFLQTPQGQAGHQDWVTLRPLVDTEPGGGQGVPAGPELWAAPSPTSLWGLPELPLIPPSQVCRIFAFSLLPSSVSQVTQSWACSYLTPYLLQISLDSWFYHCFGSLFYWPLKNIKQSQKAISVKPCIHPLCSGQGQLHLLWLFIRVEISQPS